MGMRVTASSMWRNEASCGLIRCMALLPALRFVPTPPAAPGRAGVHVVAPPRLDKGYDNAARRGPMANFAPPLSAAVAAAPDHPAVHLAAVGLASGALAAAV